MPVYMIEAGTSGMVKIGWTADSVFLRMVGLQVGNHLQLRTLREIDCCQGMEVWLQDYFCDRALRGEWFHFTPEMLSIEGPKCLRPIAPSAPLDKATQKEAAWLFRRDGVKRCGSNARADCPCWIDDATEAMVTVNRMKRREGWARGKYSEIDALPDELFAIAPAERKAAAASVPSVEAA